MSQDSTVFYNACPWHYQGNWEDFNELQKKKKKRKSKEEASSYCLIFLESVLKGSLDRVCFLCGLDVCKGFPVGSDGKKSACNAGDLGSIPGLGRLLGEGNGYPLQYSCLENSMDRGAWRTIVPMGLQRVGPDSATPQRPYLWWMSHFIKASCACLKYPWRTELESAIWV